MSDDLISRRALLEAIDSSFVIPILKINMREEHKAVNKIWGIITNMPTAFDKEEVIEELENLRAQYFITIANTGDEKLGFAYKYIWNALDHAIKIVEKGGIQ